MDRSESDRKYYLKNREQRIALQKERNRAANEAAKGLTKKAWAGLTPEQVDRRNLTVRREKAAWVRKELESRGLIRGQPTQEIIEAVKAIDARKAAMGIHVYYD